VGQGALIKGTLRISLGPMPWRLAVGLLLTLVACGGPPFGVASMPSVGAPSRTSASPAQINGTPGRPYEVASVLAAMRDSQRPGGVPHELMTDEIGRAVTSQLWTWDGQPWLVLSIGGACGPSSCSLDVTGSRADSPGADLYSFSVDPTSGAVTLATADLHAYPRNLDARLDEAGRAAAGDAVTGLAYIGARWLPPPDAGRYWLAYRSGGEEGAPGLDLLLDLANGELIESRPV
jgi:hypothetical protein